MPQRTISDLIVNSLGSLSQAGQERYASVALAEEQGVRHLIDGGAAGVLGNEQRLAGAERWETAAEITLPSRIGQVPDLLPGRILGPLTIVTGHHKLSYDSEFRAQGPETAF